MNFNQSIYFRDTRGKTYFLFQVVNFKKDRDDLKFIFNSKNEDTGFIYSSDNSFSSKKDVIGHYAEVTYHPDGVLQNKIGIKDYREGDDRIKKISLDKIDDWEPILQYNVVDYSLCKKENSSKGVLLPQNDRIFNGDPFECVFCLIHLKYTTPSTNEVGDVVFRINGLAMNVDLLLFIRKSSYQGRIMTIPNTNTTILNTGNIISKIERKKLILI